MSIAVNEIRPFWMPGLNEIEGKQKFSLAEWLTRQKYYIYSPISQNQFILDLPGQYLVNNMLTAYAYDCNRMASAAFETMYCIEQNSKIPKSTSWMIIQSYYAAFFAGHTITRMLGISCSQLGKQSVDKITEIAKLYGNDNGLKLPSSYYSCTYDNSNQQLFFDNIQVKGGVHERFWKIFSDSIRDLGRSMLANPSITTQSQNVSSKLDELYAILSYQGQNGGNWLSAIRNKVNYRHEMDAWFPYHNQRQRNINKIYGKCLMWLDDPMDISLIIQPGKPIDLFVSACHFIVSLCRVLVLDMSARCSTGKSYLNDGSLKLLKQCT